MRPTPVALLLLPACLAAQAPGTPAELFQQAKALWTGQGNRDEALAKLEQVVATLGAPGAVADRKLLCEAYNWLAVLEDRSAAQKAKVPQRFQAILDLDPDFLLDKTVTPQRLQTQFDRSREGRFVKVEAEVQPAGGRFSVDGRTLAEVPRWLAPGHHVLGYARPGYQAAETSVDLVLGSPQKVSLTLTRTSSTLQFITCPVGAEVLLDGRSLGRSSGKAGPEARETAERFGVPLEDLSAPFLVQDLTAGKHLLEVRMPCFQARRFNVGEAFTSPPDDHVMDPVKLVPAKSTLTVTSAWKGGQAFLGDQPLGPLPLTQKAVCPGTYTFTVQYPAGGFSRTLELADGQSLSLEARPKPRLAFLGLSTSGEFPGKARLDTQLQQLGARLPGLAYLLPLAGETPDAGAARLRQAQGAELLLSARTVQVSGATLVEFRLATPDGFEERLLVKPLDQDPLGELVARLEAPLPVQETGLEAVLLDLPGQPGPWVMQANETLRKAGLELRKPLDQVQGRPCATVAELRTLLAGLQAPTVTAVQEGRTLTLPLSPRGLLLPLAAPGLSYVRTLAELRLRALGAQGEEAGLLRLNLAQTLLHFRQPERALEMLRETRLQATGGVGQGTLAYLTGLCLSRLGSVYIPEAIQSFQQALRFPAATLGGPDGPRVEPLARAALHDLQPQ